MEALVALGVTSNVLQLTQFAGMLTAEVKSIRRTGSPKSLPDLQNLVRNINEQIDTVHACLNSSLSKSSTTELRKEDQKLIDVAMSCRTTAVEFLRYLDTFTSVTPSQNIIKAAFTTAKYQFEHQKIDDFVAKLDKLCSALRSGTILALRSSGDANHEIILEHMRTIHSRQVHIQQSLDASNAKIDESLRKLSDVQNDLPQTREKAILNWLNFRQMAWRQAQVAKSHKATFDWILEDTSPQRDWDDFTAYLREDTTTPYFICGKAGSGKSTLMKHLVSHAKTETYLQEWASRDNSKLLIINFYFWNSGTSLQKSAVGLLRALLYSVLMKYPEFIPTIFPLLYYKRTRDIDEPSYEEMEKAWEDLAVSAAPFLRLAIFIDGVDEFDGDHAKLSTFLRSLSTPKIKIIVSSRPIVDSLEVFHGCPYLRLERLTARDIEIFVQDKLASHPVMVWHQKRNAKECDEIIGEIKKKADGVFIWVSLVVELLGKVLRNGGTMNDLRSKLRSLPGDLFKLYSRMLSKVPEDCKQQAAEIFLLVQTWQSTVPQMSLDAMTLYYAMQPPHESLELPVGPEESEEICRKQITARVRNLCCGLVEVQEDSDSEDSDSEDSDSEGSYSKNSGSINYIHRTVAEFLMKSDIASELQKTANVDLQVKMMSACLSVLKTSAQSKNFTFGRYIGAFIKLYRRISFQPTDGQSMNDYVTALDTTMSWHQKSLLQPSDRTLHWSVWLGLGYSPEVSMGFTKGPVYPHGLAPLLESANLVSFASRVCLIQYLETTNYSDGVTPVLFALEAWAPTVCHRLNYRTFFYSKVPLSYRRDTLLLLLKNLTEDPDQTLDGVLLVIVRDDIDLTEDLAVLIAIFLVTSKDPQRLIQNGLFERHSQADVVATLRCSDDVRNQELGDELNVPKYKYTPETGSSMLGSTGVQVQYEWRPFEHVGDVENRYHEARRVRQGLKADFSETETRVRLKRRSPRDFPDVSITS